MQKYAFVYNLSGDTNWSVSTGEDYKECELSKYINIVQECYSNNKISTLVDVLNAIQRDVEKL